jgi:hypothetical protein
MPQAPELPKTLLAHALELHERYPDEPFDCVGRLLSVMTQNEGMGGETLVALAALAEDEPRMLWISESIAPDLGITFAPEE